MTTILGAFCNCAGSISCPVTQSFIAECTCTYLLSCTCLLLPAQFPGPLDGPVTVAMLEAWQTAGMDRSLYLELLELLKKMKVRYNRTAMHFCSCAARGVVGLGHGPPHIPAAAEENECV